MPMNPEVYEAKIDEFKNNKVIIIPTGGGWTMTIGLTKAKAILDHVEEINNFVESNGKSVDKI